MSEPQGSSWLCFPSARIIDTRHRAWLLMWVQGIQIQVLILAQQAPHPAPTSIVVHISISVYMLWDRSSLSCLVLSPNPELITPSSWGYRHKPSVAVSLPGVKALSYAYPVTKQVSTWALVELVDCQSVLCASHSSQRGRHAGGLGINQMPLSAHRWEVLESFVF